MMMKCYVTFGLFLSITVTVQSQSQCESFSFVCLVDVNTYSLPEYSDCDLAKRNCDWSTADISQ